MAIPHDWWMALLGGGLIGLAAAGLMFFNGRIAGISGIWSGLWFERGDQSGRFSFIGGLLAGGVILRLVYTPAVPDLSQVSWWQMGLAGLLVGMGTRLGSGCTSGHGVCGLARFSVRSLAATLTFMATGFLTVFLIGRAAAWL